MGLDVRVACVATLFVLWCLCLDEPDARARGRKSSVRTGSAGSLGPGPARLAKTIPQFIVLIVITNIFFRVLYTKHRTLLVKVCRPTVLQSVTRLYLINRDG